MSDYEKALNHLARNYYNPKFDSYNTLEKVQSLKALRELVDRATPKKPVWEHAYMCDACFNQEVNSDMNFCPNCGQALDWSSEQIAKGETK